MMHCRAQISALVAALALWPLAAVAAPADPNEDFAQQPLRFANLEFAMPTDPLLWSSDPGWKPHRTPPQLLASAREQLRDAVPVGTPAAQAAAVLRAAGARCAAPTGAELVCRYEDTENPQGGDYHDNITWTVTAALANGEVGDLAVRRDWTRR
jgi:hypothetical protein